MNFLNPSTKDINTTAENSSRKQISVASESLLQNLLNGSLILGTVLFFLNMYSAIQASDYLYIGLMFVAYDVIFMVTFARMLPYHLRANCLAAAYYFIGVISMVQTGLNANALLFFLFAVLIIGILEEKNYWVIPMGITALTVSALTYLFQLGILHSSSTLVTSNSVLYWISVIIDFLFLIFLATVPLSRYLDELRSLINKLDQSISALAAENQQLDKNRTEFENSLDRRRLRLVTTRQIAREISQQSDLEKLMRDSVDLIRSQLGYYHAAIFLSDDRAENAFLKAATGEIGKTLLERNFRIRIHDTGLVSSVISQGEPRFTNDLTQESVQNKNSTLPNTQSELVVPLRMGQSIIGALDVQSDKKDAFSDEDIEVLQSIADQLSTVIDKTTQIQQLKNNVATLEENYRSYTQGVWRSYL